MEKMEEQFNFEINILNQNEKELKMTLDDMNRENGELRKRLEEEIQLRIKL